MHTREREASERRQAALAAVDAMAKADPAWPAAIDEVLAADEAYRDARAEAIRQNPRIIDNERDYKVAMDIIKDKTAMVAALVAAVRTYETIPRVDRLRDADRVAWQNWQIARKSVVASTAELVDATKNNDLLAVERLSREHVDMMKNEQNWFAASQAASAAYEAALTNRKTP